MKETDHHIKMALIWGVIIILVFVLFGFLGRIKRQGNREIRGRWRPRW